MVWKSWILSHASLINWVQRHEHVKNTKEVLLHCSMRHLLRVYHSRSLATAGTVHILFYVSLITYVPISPAFFPHPAPWYGDWTQGPLNTELYPQSFSFFETEFHEVAQAGLELVDSRSASQVVGIIDVCHCPQPVLLCPTLCEKMKAGADAAKAMHSRKCIVWRVPVRKRME